LTTPITASGPLDISTTTTYTIEAWVYWTASAGNRDVWTWGGKQTGGPSSYYQLYWATVGNVLKWEQGSTTAPLITVTTSLTPTLNTWYHIAIVRSGSSITVYANGQSIGTGTYAPNDQQFAEFCLGSLFYTTGYLQFLSGYVSNFRFVKGTAVYTGAFTPPTLAPLTTAGSTSAASYTNTTNVNTSFASSNTSLLLNFTNAGIYDATTQNVVTTAGAAVTNTTTKQWSPSSISFNGSNSYARVSYNTIFNLGTSNFTVEFWVYFNSVASGQTVAGRHNITSAGDWAIYTATNGNLNYYLSSTGSTWNLANQVSIGSISVGTWYYVALVRNGSVFTPYIGTTPGSAPTAGTTTTTASALATITQDLTVAASNDSLTFLNGYVQDFRFTVGAARPITTVPSASFPVQ
jgi:hypothetical protein